MFTLWKSDSRVRKKHFTPRGKRAEKIGLRGFLIKSGVRRGVSNGNMHVRSRDFAGGVRPAPFVKRGCDSITIHPSIPPHGGGHAMARSERWENFFLSSFPSAPLSLYRNQENAKRISNSISCEICRARAARREFSARGTTRCSAVHMAYIYLRWILNYPFLNYPLLFFPFWIHRDISIFVVFSIVYSCIKKNVSSGSHYEYI